MRHSANMRHSDGSRWADTCFLAQTMFLMLISVHLSTFVLFCMFGLVPIAPIMIVVPSWCLSYSLGME